MPDGQEGQGAKLRSGFAAQEFETFEDVVFGPKVGVDVECADHMVDGGCRLKPSRVCIRQSSESSQSVAVFAVIGNTKGSDGT